MPKNFEVTWFRRNLQYIDVDCILPISYLWTHEFACVKYNICYKLTDEYHVVKNTARTVRAGYK